MNQSVEWLGPVCVCVYVCVGIRVTLELLREAVASLVDQFLNSRNLSVVAFQKIFFLREQG